MKSAVEIRTTVTMLFSSHLPKAVPAVSATSKGNVIGK
jgi:hypothetical protein